MFVPTLPNPENMKAKIPISEIMLLFFMELQPLQ